MIPMSPFLYAKQIFFMLWPMMTSSATKEGVSQTYRQLINQGMETSEVHFISKRDQHATNFPPRVWSFHAGSDPRETVGNWIQGFTRCRTQYETEVSRLSFYAP